MFTEKALRHPQRPVAEPERRAVGVWALLNKQGKASGPAGYAVAFVTG